MSRTGIKVMQKASGIFGRCRDSTSGKHSPQILAAIIVLVSLALVPAATAADLEIEAFFGTYEGSSISTNADGLSTRDMKVSIAPTGRGFNVTWNTITHRADGTSKRKTYSIDFETTKRKGIFGSEMRRNKFGDRVPLDPLSGEPYVWARITEDTLTVYALHITAEGSYEMQVYDRTRTEHGLDVRFTRFSEGEPMKVITGTLVRTGG